MATRQKSRKRRLIPILFLWGEIVSKSKFPDRDWKKSVLRVFLRKMPFDVVIDNFISMVDHLCGEDDEAFTKITHEIVTYVQVRELLNGTKPNLEGYVPKRKLELFKELLKFSGGTEVCGTEVSDDVAETLLKDFETSKKTFSDWWLSKTSSL